MIKKKAENILLEELGDSWIKVFISSDDYSDELQLPKYLSKVYDMKRKGKRTYVSVEPSGCLIGITNGLDKGIMGYEADIATIWSNLEYICSVYDDKHLAVSKSNLLCDSRRDEWIVLEHMLYKISVDKGINVVIFD